MSENRIVLGTLVRGGLVRVDEIKVSCNLRNPVVSYIGSLDGGRPVRIEGQGENTQAALENAATILVETVRARLGQDVATLKYFEQAGE